MFSIKEALGYGWQMVRKNWQILLGGMLIFAVLLGADRFFGNTTLDDSSKILTVLFFLSALMLQIVEYEMILGGVKVALKIHDGQKAIMADYFSCFPLIFKYIGAIIIYYILIIGIPGLLAYLIYKTGGLIILNWFLYLCAALIFIYLAAQAMFYSFFIVDKNCGPLNCFKESFALTKGHELKFMLFWLMLVLLNLLGFACLIVGLFITLPVTLLSLTYVYRQVSR
jgi:hypothetical protein